MSVFAWILTDGWFLASSGHFNWGLADILVNWATSNGQLVRGYSLIWLSGLPLWLTSISDAATMVRSNWAS
jgi:GH35 family endo-1,4-beta-xylanase